jgi:hypothetical protein
MRALFDYGGVINSTALLERGNTGYAAKQVTGKGTETGGMGLWPSHPWRLPWHRHPANWKTAVSTVLRFRQDNCRYAAKPAAYVIEIGRKENHPWPLPGTNSLL